MPLEVHECRSGSIWTYGSTVSNYFYVICCTVDGLFDVNQTSAELRGNTIVDQFSSLALAKAWCEDREAYLAETTNHS